MRCTLHPSFPGRSPAASKTWTRRWWKKHMFWINHMDIEEMEIVLKRVMTCNDHTPKPDEHLAGIYGCNAGGGMVSEGCSSPCGPFSYWLAGGWLVDDTNSSFNGPMVLGLGLKIGCSTPNSKKWWPCSNFEYRFWITLGHKARYKQTHLAG